MRWFKLAQTFSILITIVRIGRLSEQEKDLEILAQHLSVVDNSMLFH